MHTIRRLTQRVQWVTQTEAHSGHLHEQTRLDEPRSRSKNCGIGAAETEESVTLGRSRKRKRWDSHQGYSITLVAIRMGVKLYNVRSAAPWTSLEAVFSQQAIIGLVQWSGCGHSIGSCFFGFPIALQWLEQLYSQRCLGIFRNRDRSGIHQSQRSRPRATKSRKRLFPNHAPSRAATALRASSCEPNCTNP